MQRRALLFGLLTAACGKSRKPLPVSPVVWLDDVDLAYAQAKRIGRPVFLYFGASWDCASKELEHVTFPDPEVASLLYSRFVCARVDCSDDENRLTMDLTKRFDITGTPTLIVTHPVRGHDLWRANEFVKPDALAVALRAARARHDAMHDAEAALRLGAAWRRPVAFLFGAPPDPHDYDVTAILRDSFVFVDTNDNWDRFQVRDFPTTVVMDGERGIEIARLETPVGPRQYRAFLDSALLRYRA